MLINRVSVGRDRARYLGRLTGRPPSVRFPIPPVATVHAAFTAHGDPRRGLTGVRVPLASARIPKPSRLGGATSVVTTGPPLPVWPFALYAAFPRSDYYGHADSLQAHWRFSGLLPAHYFRSPSHRRKGLPCSQWWTQTGSRRWWLSANLYLLPQAPQWIWGTAGLPIPLFCCARRLHRIEGEDN